MEFCLVKLSILMEYHLPEENFYFLNLDRPKLLVTAKPVESGG